MKSILLLLAMLSCTACAGAFAGAGPHGVSVVTLQRSPVLTPEEQQRHCYLTDWNPPNSHNIRPLGLAPHFVNEQGVIELNCPPTPGNLTTVRYCTVGEPTGVYTNGVLVGCKP
jgi:hypothetical protein